VRRLSGPLTTPIFASMQTPLIWIGRAALLGVFAVAFSGAVDPHHNATRNVPPPDVVEHVVYGYLLTVLTMLSAPRFNAWWIGAAFLAVLSVQRLLVSSLAQSPKPQPGLRP